MGNLCSLFAPPKPVKKRRPITKRQPSVPRSAFGPRNRRRSSSSSSTRDNKLEDAILFGQQNSGEAGSLPFDRSASQRYPVSGSKKNQLPRSSSSRSRSSTDPLLQPHQFLNKMTWKQTILSSSMEEVSAPWCWYKTIALLEEDGFKVTAIDLAGCGINSCNINSIASLSQYLKPLADVLEKLHTGEKVISVAHDFGGAYGNYGSVRRFYIETLDDNAIPLALQENMINSSPPEKVYRLKGADHAPFFSKPQALHKLLLEIARIKASHRDMTRSVFFFFIVSLLLLLLAVDLATASSGNTTSGFGYGGCASGDTVGECITAAVEEEEGVEAVVRRVLQQQRRKLSYAALQKQQSCNGKIAGNCIGTANRRNAPCTYYNRCKRAT
ncbi:hypothetical protein F2Q68_00011866 [Brassica cretica]|uniref:AB hydrolase-1 domain-containing protein n=1 Tax=Brassica cretica TaxID=69181 RepID=A0A8S9KWA1_BRACR|nr:hypothetical protein F2Q68_00011866 [Brassica cretica]